MNVPATVRLAAPLIAAGLFLAAAVSAQTDARLPQRVRAVWDGAKAHRETTPTRERICLNGLWRWQPAASRSEALPAGQWGYFKVPGSWPGITDYMQKDCQVVFSHPGWKDVRLRDLTSAWYQREIEVPKEWEGRRLVLEMECLNSVAAVFVDGSKAGNIWFPAGQLDLTRAFRPGNRHLLSILVTAMPLKEVMVSHRDTATAKEVRGSVARRGLCGDVFLASEPAGPRVADMRVDTSVRKGEIAFEVALEKLEAGGRYMLKAEVRGPDGERRQFESEGFSAADTKEGRWAFVRKWRPERLWDLHTPTNLCEVQVSLLAAGGGVLDTGWRTRFGFREFWIEGRDFYLNGSRIFLAAVPLDNAQVGAAWATLAGARESLERLKSFGINFVYTHNYGCEPGSHLSFGEILKAADEAGMLVALSQPHFSHYEWKSPEADRTNGYARHAEYYARTAGSHPSVVFYSMSHNATGYAEDMNPDMIDGVHEARDQWALNNARLAQRAEAIVRRLDPGRIVYHHASGNLGPMHAINYYPNFVPVQEQCDWFEHWATQGVKPVFTCEYGAPFTWDWTMYRGWYNGQREFGSAKVPWEFCLAEWNAQFFGDRAFRISEPEKANLRWEARQYRAGALWHRWDYPCEVGSTRLEERYPVFALYLTDNWRAFRAMGVSALSPWEYGHYWRLRPGVKRGRQQLEVDWENLQRPGFSADYLEERYERMDLAYEREDWIPTAAALALLRNNLPVLGYIGGKPAALTSKDHNYRAGGTCEKQLIAINNSRTTATCRCEWAFRWPEPVRGEKNVTLAAGEQCRIPVSSLIPGGLAPGAYELRAAFQFDGHAAQEDSVPVHVLPPLPGLETSQTVALYDPKGETRAWLDGVGVRYKPVAVAADLTSYNVLIVGRGALTLEGEAPDIGRVRDGLKVLVFEQTSEVLEKRLGFRVVEYGLRGVFKRLADHPALAGMGEEHLRDWNGEATLLPPRLRYEMRPRYGPTVKWCDIPVTRLWRCGNRGSVASVLIEKPVCGDFLPILDGGYSLQYSPLLEYREGQGMVLFCQMDVTSRTEPDPAAERLALNLLRYVADWKPPQRKSTVYVGEGAGRAHLEAAGFAVRAYAGGGLSADQVLVVGPGGGATLGQNKEALGRWLQNGGCLLAAGLDESEANTFLPVKLSTRREEHISTWFDVVPCGSAYAGIGPADTHNRDPRQLPLVASGAEALGDGVVARAEQGRLVFCQLVPWQFGPSQQANLRRTFRRTSFLFTRLLGNAGASSTTPILARFHSPARADRAEKRWLNGLYLDRPEEWDDPYRFFRW